MDNHLTVALQRAITGAAAATRRARKPEAIDSAKRQWRLLTEVQDYIGTLEARLAAATPAASAAPAGAEHPFAAFTYMSDNGPVQTYHLGADDRLRVVPTLTAEQCAAALRMPDLQVAVRKAVERRQRTLAKAEVANG
ncbi:hypothetical protein [Thermomonas fusca]